MGNRRKNNAGKKPRPYSGLITYCTTPLDCLSLLSRFLLHFLATAGTLFFATDCILVPPKQTRRLYIIV